MSVNVVGVNPTVTSEVNVKVMEPEVILASDYVDGLIGWVDYAVMRGASFRTKLTIRDDYKSDVDVVTISYHDWTS